MNYTLNQLQVFVKVAQTGSITKASEELHLTQPAVSIQLRKFQDLFDIPLIEVVRRKLYMTDFGKEVALLAEKILQDTYSLNYKTLAHKGQLTGRLKFSIVSTGKYIMPYFLTDFMSRHKGVELIIDVTNKSKVIDSLMKNEVDFSLVSVLPDTLHIEKIPLIQNKLYVVTNREMLLKKKIYAESILKEIPMIYREEGSGTRVIMEKYIHKHKLPVQKKMELTSNEAVKQAVIAGLGCSIMPLIGLKNELGTGQIQIIPVKQFPIKSFWYLIWLKGKKFSPVAKAYLEHIHQQKEDIIHRNFEWFEKY